MSRRAGIPLAASALLAAALVGGLALARGGSRRSESPAAVTDPYSPTIDRANFVNAVDNPWFPLRPGTTLRYHGVAENGRTPQVDVATVLARKQRVLGVDCTVVRDTVTSGGRPVERTYDWYAQDRQGNVWYFGEDSRNFKHGRYVKGHDSWESGVDGAKPGIIMEGSPQRGDTYRQEYYVGHAEDQARVLGSGGRVRTPYRTFPTTLATVERSRLEPGARERKFYAAGVGEIESKVVRGDHERFALVAVRRPRSSRAAP
jgi:hypothetical protein